MKRHEVQVLLAAGMSHRQVAKQTGVPRTSVQRLAREGPLQTLSDVAEARRRGVGRPSSARPFEPQLRDILSAEPKLPSVEILHRVRQQGYAGGKSALYALVHELRGPAPRPLVVRFEGLPGEFAQFDFGTVQVRTLSGKTERVRFAAYRLKYSRWVHVELVENEQVETLCRALLGGFENSGGVPLSVVFDNPTTVVTDRKQTPVVWNRTLAQLATDYGFAIELCTPRRANEKGAVENLVGWVKGSFFKVRRFHDQEDLAVQLQGWLREVNEERPSRATGEIPAARLAEEQKRLRPLALAPRDYGLHFERIVGPTAMVSHRGVRYAMPADAIGLPATLRVYPDRVRITAGRHDLTHPRFPAEGGRLSYPPEIRAQHLATVSGSRGRLYFMRERLLELGPVAVHFLTEVVHRRPRTWKGDVEVLYALLEKVGSQRLVSALQAAELRALYGAEYVRHFATTEEVA